MYSGARQVEHAVRGDRETSAPRHARGKVAPGPRLDRGQFLLPGFFPTRGRFGPARDLTAKFGPPARDRSALIAAPSAVRGIRRIRVILRPDPRKVRCLTTTDCWVELRVEVEVWP